MMARGEASTATAAMPNRWSYIFFFEEMGLCASNV